MPTLSQKRKDKISEQILHYLYSIAPQSAFISKIAEEIARDEEFTKSIIQDLQKKELVFQITKNPKGTDYKTRRRWRLSNKALEVYKRANRS